MVRQVRDIALQSPVMVSAQVEIGTAEELLISRNASAVYVVDDSEQLLGMVPDQEFLNYRLMGGDGQARIAALMSPVALALECTASIDQVCRLFKEENVGSLPVVRQGQLVGQFSRCNLLKIIVESTTTGEFDILPDLSSTAFASRAESTVRPTWMRPVDLREVGKSTQLIIPHIAEAAMINEDAA
ncbi:MAG TPA: CBS domain-containing protein [Planctomicrobium sp.]|nr:CBS domain-containing protein [Planctomicrobium sp.]